jgi:hypothetical protein
MLLLNGFCGPYYRKTHTTLKSLGGILLHILAQALGLPLIGIENAGVIMEGG